MVDRGVARRSGRPAAQSNVLFGGRIKKGLPRVVSDAGPHVLVHGAARRGRMSYV